MVATFEQIRTKKLKTFDELRAKPSDYGRIALPKERLPGVWDYDKQLDQLLGDPEIDIEDLMPLDVRYDFGRIVGMTEKPDEIKEKMTNSLYYSVQFGIPPDISFNLIDKLMEMTKFNPLKATPEDRGFFGKIAESWRRGDTQVMGDISVYETAFENMGDEEQALASLKKLQLEQALDPIEGWFLADLVYSGVEVIPGMARGYWEAIPKAFAGMATGAGMALAAGQVPPLTLAPEEIVGVPAGALFGAKYGLMAGSAMFWYKQGAGSMYATMRENDYNPELSKHIAGAAAVPYAIVEFLQVSQLTPGLRRGALNVAQKSMLKVVANATKKYGTVWGTEVFEEVVQEIIQIGAEDMAGFLSDKLKLPTGVSEFLLERGRRVWETTKEAGKAMALLPIPGATIDVYTGRRTIVPVEKIPEIEAKPAVVEVKVPPTEVIPAPEKPVAPITPEKPPITPAKPEAVEVAPKAIKGIERIRKLDVKQRELEKSADQILGTSGVGQAPPVYHRELEKIIEIQKKKAEIWNAIRGSIVEPSGKTLWQLAVEKYPVTRFGKEEALGIYAKDIDKLLAQPVAKAEPTKVIEEPRTYKTKTGKIVESPIRLFGDGTDLSLAELHRMSLDEVISVKRYSARRGGVSRGKIKVGNLILPELITQPQPVAKGEPAKVKKEVLGLTAEEQKEYKRLKEIQEIMRKKGLGAISKESADRKRIIELEEKMALAKAAEPGKSKLRQKIQVVAALKGLTKKVLSELKMKHTGYRTIEGKIAEKKITTEQLENLLSAVLKARPKQVGYKKVITKKTEERIQTLKKNLKAVDQMSETSYQEILQRETSGKEPTYIDVKNFVTQTQGQAVIKRMLYEAEVQRVVLPHKNAVEKNKSISEAYGKIKKTGEIKDPCRLRSMRFYAQRLAYKAGVPIYDLYLSIIDTNNHLERVRVKVKEHLMKMTGYDDIVKDEVGMQRISDYIASKSYLKIRPVQPKDITQQEEAIAKYIESTLKKWRWKARVAKFFDVEGRYTEIPQYEIPQHRESINKTVEILETKGTDAAIDYMKTQEWGVIRSGYEPLENITLRIRAFVMPAKALAKGHIKPRTQIEYMPQERNIFQRFDSYLRQIDNLSVLKPKINAFTRLIEDNLDNFDNPQDVRTSIEVFLLNLKHINPSGNGLVEKVIRVLYGQALTVRVLGDPLKVVRNYPTQNLVFEQDKSTLFDPRNKPLTAEDMEYFRTNIEQSNPLMREWAFAGEKPLPIPIVKQLTQFIRRYTFYPWSDTKNRLMSDTAKINQVRRAVDEAGKNIDKMMKLAKFSDYEVTEQRMALGILALEGSDAMSRYIARCHVENTHYLYDTKQRSPAEQTVTGKLVLNLFLFRRASLEKLFRNISKVAEKTATPEQRLRATKVVSVLLVSSFVTAWLWKRLTGQRRSPYDYIGFMELQPGGLAWGTVESFSEAYNNLLNATRGDAKALELMAISIPRCSDLILPFYKQTLDAIEATMGAKNLDRKAIRKLRDLIDKEYKIRGGAYKVEREWYEAIQYAIAGAGVDVKEEKKGKVTKF